MRTDCRVLLIALMIAGGLRAAGTGVDMPKLSPHQRSAASPDIRVAPGETVVTLSLSANNSPHVLCTSSEFNRSRNVYVLHYVLAQNRDLFVRSRKQVTVEWRLRDFRGDRRNIEVRGAIVTFTTAQLTTLMPRPIRPAPLR